MGVPICEDGGVRIRRLTRLHHFFLREQSRSKAGVDRDSAHKQEHQICRLAGNTHNSQMVLPQGGGVGG